MILPSYGDYALIILVNRIKNLIVKRENHKYLFILSPPFCGSTILTDLIATADSVSVNNNRGTREGQTLPTLRRIMFDHERRWDLSLNYNWDEIKNEWLKYWDLSCSILLEKSPPNITRAKSIENSFTPSYFIILYRNPYAHCESLIRQANKSPSSAAKFSIDCLKFQKFNISALKKQAHFSYEMLTEDTENVIANMSNMLPELSVMQFEREYANHDALSRNIRIKNFNKRKIQKLTEGQLQEINDVFINEKEILNYFNYKLIY